MDKTTNLIRGTTPEIKLRAKQLRNNMTPAEKVLWEALRKKPLNGLKFRRQHPVGRFILDFYCAQYKLVVEIDGEIHLTQQEYDAARTKHLNSYGYKVIRFSNNEVFHNLDSVLERIWQTTLDSTL
ncbi:conserved hypothetical protein [Hyella patelloides LEGE 07179]|uniref:DUF559 domain-containing protein n=1 Tax=Hyella patelloides LEGE 07179 TaxID=945734 RepID=A0A563VRF8_9CYAN|nr:endonuclease domain-containing protein [Hyella patelloides]VEP14003.1 conserved hypothetical protein [Hyella patelloides LEGE 07179]